MGKPAHFAQRTVRERAHSCAEHNKLADKAPPEAPMAGHAVAPTKEPDDSISIRVVPKVDPPPCVWVVARAILLYLLWAFFGFISGAHLFGLMCCPPPSVASRKFVGVQLATHFGALLVFGIGGGTCRSMGADDCPGGEEMSQSCFWYHQNSTYQFFYITHFMALTWLFVQWLSDGLSLWGWSGDCVREVPATADPKCMWCLTGCLRLLA